MPFRSKKQRAYMYEKHPKIAEKWSKEEKTKKGKRSPWMDMGGKY